MFQSLTGSIHTLPTNICPFTGRGVSIPHRFNSHVPWWTGQVVRPPVSIPHRFNSHTINEMEKVKLLLVFQSLTGSIHTYVVGGYLCFNSGFQSLTGSIHTNEDELKSTFNLTVSIPHRFNSHRELIYWVWGKRLFQSLTGSIHTCRHRLGSLCMS